ncbi:MAG TPA: GNAT family N-acetyltransferase [Candidatus Acidoferrum sp.]|nr:GNAT family N-acetyltransferase [Candidatus Acidoferrum sp.]
MDAWRRAITFIRAHDERTAEEVVPCRWGRALINRSLNLVHDANYLIADQLDGADTETLIAAAEDIQGRAPLRHRRVNVDDQPAADLLRHGFASHGYQPERFVLMEHRRRPDRSVDHGQVRQVDWSAIRPARELDRSQQPWASPLLVEQLLAWHELSGHRIKTRYFAAVDEGQVVSSCELRTEGDVAQIETVETLAEFRRRGLSRAVMSAALAAAADYRFVFLVADADDWPQDFYRRLGFDAVGIESRFLRLLDG